jgi:hypothetical protein
MYVVRRPEHYVHKTEVDRALDGLEADGNQRPAACQTGCSALQWSIACGTEVTQLGAGEVPAAGAASAAFVDSITFDPFAAVSGNCQNALVSVSLCATNPGALAAQCGSTVIQLQTLLR